VNRREHTEPEAKVAGLPKVFQVGHPLKLAIANADSHYRRLVLPMQEVNTVAALQPVGKPRLIYSFQYPAGSAIGEVNWKQKTSFAAE